MDHAEASDRIADLALEPRRIIDLELDPSPESRALLVHVQGCATCLADLEAWRQTHEVVLQATASAGLGRLGEAADEVSAGPPARLRAAVSAIPGRSPRLLVAEGAPSAAPSAERRMDDRRQRGWHLPALAAVVVVALVVGLGALAVDRVRQADVARGQTAELAALTTSVERVLRDPGHTSISLVGSGGGPAGAAAWSADEIVVVSAALTPPGSGAEYRCWVERDGQRTPIGVMRFADGLAYWSGPLARYGDLTLAGGGRLGVSLETVGQGGGGAPVLVGELPS